MVFRVIFKIFQLDWKLKEKCRIMKEGKYKYILTRLYDFHQFLNCSSIAWESEFKSKPKFPHGTSGIYVSRGAKIGYNCTILQHVTIGSNTLAGSKKYGYPEVGDDCFIGAGAVIVGNVKIGNNVKIGANATVYKDVGDNLTVVSSEQKNINTKCHNSL